MILKIIKNTNYYATIKIQFSVNEVTYKRILVVVVAMQSHQLNFKFRFQFTTESSI